MAEKTQPTETPTTTPINHVALWSMITGLAGLTVGWAIPLPWSLAAVILGHIGLSQVKGERGNNRGFAVAGLVTGYIGIGLVLLLIALVAFVVAAFGLDEIMQFIRMMTFDSAPFDMSRELPEGWSAP